MNTISRAINSRNAFVNSINRQTALKNQVAAFGKVRSELNPRLTFTVDKSNHLNNKGMSIITDNYKRLISATKPSSSPLINKQSGFVSQGNSIHQPSFQDGFYFSLLKNSSNPSSFANMLCSISV